MVVVEASQGSRWIEVGVAFLLGLLSSWLIEFLREQGRKRRMTQALRREIERNRGIAVATAWEIAISERRVTVEIARRTLGVVTADPVRAATMDQATMAQLQRLSTDAATCVEFNRNVPPGERWIAPPALGMTVYAAQTEVLGHLRDDAGIATMNVYAAIPGINRIAEDMQSATRDLALIHPSQNHVRAEFTARLTTNQETLGRLYEVFIGDCDRALQLLREAGARSR